MKTLKSIYFAYIKFFWYADTGLGEIRKSGTFITTIMSAATFFKVFGVEIQLWQVPVFGIIMMAISMFVGYLLIQKMETIKYMNSIVNKHNSELMEILEIVKDIKKTNG